jgi:sugar phosphate isomerase/epimerase
MTVGIGLCWGTIQQATLIELIDVAGRYGFPTLSVRPDMVLSTIADGINESELRRRLRDAALRIVTIDAVSLARGSPDALGMEDCLRAAEIVEAPIVNANSFGGNPIGDAELIDRVGRVAQAAARRGLAVALEFVPDTSLPDLATAHRVAVASRQDNCSVLLDFWHHSRANGTMAEIEKMPPGALGGIQLDDRTPPKPGTPYLPASGRDLPGEGRLPLGDLLRAALSNSPGLSVELEVFSAELRAMTADAAAARVAQAVRNWRSDNDF